MFTGIIQEKAKVFSIIESESITKLSIQSKLDYSSSSIGDSISINGVCLTLVDLTNDILSFDVAKETLNKTALLLLEKSDDVNLEKSLRVGDQLGGHFVSGHIDCTTEIADKKSEGDSWRYILKLPEAIAKFIAYKGSIAINGISLTIASVDKDTFSVVIIPHTLEMTNLSNLTLGAKVNLEVDLLSRYAVNYLDLNNEN